ncbi:MAG: AAA family ATPase [Pseudomonadota bacterium]|nr:AAA family ATPase [Pseudomonadota bacterium]
MRFERLAVPAFGPFTRFVLELPTGGSDFHLIYGPNEAGKSSLLRAIRDLLYGIHGQTPDNFLHDYKDLRIAGTILNSAGQRLSIQRRKGNRNTLLDETGNVLPDETLAGFLGVVDRGFFSSIFGLGADELRRGAEALLHGQGELGQALFSASLAGTPVHRILEALDAEARTLFDGRARINVSIRPAVSAYEESQRQSRAALVRPEAWEETLKALADAREARDRLDDDLKARRTRRDWLQRCLDALPTLGQLSEQEQRRAELPAMPDLGSDFVDTAEQAIEERDKAQAELSRLTLRTEELKDRVRDNQPSKEVLAQSAGIESVHQQLVVYRRWKNEQVSMEADLARAESELRAGMRQLGITGEPDAVESLRAQAAEELALREAAGNLDSVAERLQAYQDETARIKRELDKAAKKLAALPTADVSALRSALARTTGAAEAAKGLSEKEADLTTALRKLERQHGLLKGAPADHRATFELRVPAAATLRQLETESTRIDLDLTRAEDAVSEADGKLQQLGGQLDRLERRGALPTIAALQEARDHRNRGWEQVLAAWKGGGQEGELDGRPLADAYPLTVKKADLVADQLREDAETVAQAEELRLQLRDAEAAKVQTQAKLEEVRTTREDWEGRWNRLWSPCGIAPASPAEMLEWRDQWTELRARYEAWEKAFDELAGARADIQNAVAILGPLLGDSRERPLPVLREEAERKVQEADEAKGARALLKTQEADFNADMEKLVTAQPELIQSKELARAAWQAQCAVLGLPTEASTGTGLALLDQRKQVVGKLDAWTGLQPGIDGTRKAISEFETHVHTLADGIDLAAGAVEVRESALWAALEAARARQTRQTQAQADLEQESEQLPRVQEALAEATRKVADSIVLSGTSDEAALKALLTDLRARQAVDAEIERLRQTLHVAARGEPLDAFIERVRAEPADSLTAERDGLDQAIPALEAQRDQAVQKLATAEDEKLELEQSGAEASEYRQTALNTAARIRHDASRYLRLLLAMHFLREQIDQFRKQNQAPLLARAGEVFRAITEGSFEGLGTAFAADDTPVLVGLRQGKEVGIQGMSDGTRDQLYLALRLAAIERHQEYHEPMPLILDDLLVTFDNRRAAAILPILRDLGRKTQVLLFTHHRHLTELARGVLTEDGFHFHELSAREIST